MLTTADPTRMRSLALQTSTTATSTTATPPGGLVKVGKALTTQAELLRKGNRTMDQRLADRRKNAYFLAGRGRKTGWMKPKNGRKDSLGFDELSDFFNASDDGEEMDDNADAETEEEETDDIKNANQTTRVETENQQGKDAQDDHLAPDEEITRVAIMTAASLFPPTTTTSSSSSSSLPSPNPDALSMLYTRDMTDADERQAELIDVMGKSINTSLPSSSSLLRVDLDQPTTLPPSTAGKAAQSNPNINADTVVTTDDDDRSIFSRKLVSSSSSSTSSLSATASIKSRNSGRRNSLYGAPPMGNKLARTPPRSLPSATTPFAANSQDTESSAIISGGEVSDSAASTASDPTITAVPLPSLLKKVRKSSLLRSSLSAIPEAHVSISLPDDINEPAQSEGPNYNEAHESFGGDFDHEVPFDAHDDNEVDTAPSILELKDKEITHQVMDYEQQQHGEAHSSPEKVVIPTKKATASKAKKAPAPIPMKASGSKRPASSSSSSSSSSRPGIQFKLPLKLETDDGDEDQDEGTTRRSKRVKIAPVQYWKNEKVVLERNGSEILPVVVKAPSSPLPGIAKKRVVKKAVPPPKLPPVPSECSVVNYASRKEEKQKIVVTANQLNPRTVGAGDYRFQKIFAEGDFIASGVLFLPKGSQKPVKNSNHSAMIFVVLNGTVKATVHTNSFTIDSGSQFFVPRGNQYSISNVGELEARLFFCHSKEIEKAHPQQE